MRLISRAGLLGTALMLVPLLAAAAPLCAVQPSGTATAADARPVSAQPPPPLPPGAIVTHPAPDADLGLAPIPSIEADRVPALRRIRASGARLYELGDLHGLRGIFAVDGPSFAVFYLTPDGQAAIRGIAQDADGRNLTRDQVAKVPGVVPTVVVGDAPRPSPAAPDQTVVFQAPATSLLQAVQTTGYGVEGRDDAPRLWVFVDPQCGVSRRAIDALRPYVAAGRVQLAVVPVAILDRGEGGPSAAAAAAMLGLPREAMVAAWMGDRLAGPPDPGAIVTLHANMLAADRIGLRGTPTFVWREADGGEGRADGLPGDVGAMVASVAK